MGSYKVGFFGNQGTVKQYLNPSNLTDVNVAYSAIHVYVPNNLFSYASH